MTLKSKRGRDDWSAERRSIDGETIALLWNTFSLVMSAELRGLEDRLADLQGLVATLPKSPVKERLDADLRDIRQAARQIPEFLHQRRPPGHVRVAS